MRDRVRNYLGGYETRAGFNISWGAIFAGIVTFLALFIVFSTLSSAYGLGVIDLTSGNPFNNLGSAAILWTILTMVISFFGGGFIAGVAARRIGLLHGFVTWAANLIVLVIFVGYILSGLLSFAGDVAGTAVNVAGDVAGTAGTAVVEGFDTLTDNLDVNVDVDEAQANTAEILEDTGVEELQPEYIQNHLDEAGNDITEAAQAILVNPDNSDQILSDLGDQLSSRAEDVGQAVDEDAISASVARNTDLSPAEAEEATQNIVQGVEQSAQTAQEAINTTANQLQNLPQQLDQAIQNLQQTAEDATNVSAWTLLGLFVAHVLMAIVSSLGGMLGSNLVKDSVHEPEA